MNNNQSLAYNGARKKKILAIIGMSLVGVVSVSALAVGVAALIGQNNKGKTWISTSAPFLTYYSLEDGVPLASAVTNSENKIKIVVNFSAPKNKDAYWQIVGDGYRGEEEDNNLTSEHCDLMPDFASFTSTQETYYLKYSYDDTTHNKSNMLKIGVKVTNGKTSITTNDITLIPESVEGSSEALYDIPPIDNVVTLTGSANNLPKFDVLNYPQFLNSKPYDNLRDKTSKSSEVCDYFNKNFTAKDIALMLILLAYEEVANSAVDVTVKLDLGWQGDISPYGGIRKTFMDNDISHLEPSNYGFDISFNLSIIPTETVGGYPSYGDYKTGLSSNVQAVGVPARFVWGETHYDKDYPSSNVVDVGIGDLSTAPERGWWYQSTPTGSDEFTPVQYFDINDTLANEDMTSYFMCGVQLPMSE